MFGRPGIAYVYLVYGMYDCLNVVTEPDGEPAALLVRAVEPEFGVEAMRVDRVLATARRRSASPVALDREAGRIEALPSHRLASGPGLVAAAFGLDRTWTGVDLCDSHSALRLEAPRPDDAPVRVVTTPRIGIQYAGEPWISRAWRFVVSDSPAVSGETGRRRLAPD